MAILRIELLTGLVWSLSAASAPADQADALRRAEQAVQDGLARRDNPQDARSYFMQAAQQYEVLNAEGVHNAALFRNEGNAYLLAGDLPRAIFAYRRGLRLAPGDPTLKANLLYAREQVDYPSPDGFGRPPVDHWPPGLPRPTLRRSLAWAVGMYASGLLLLTRWWMTRRGGWLAAGLAVLALSALPLAGVVHESWQEWQQARHPLVVMGANRVPLRNGDGAAYPARYDGKTLNRGVEARILSERGEWLHIELAGGETGWVLRGAVLLDVAGSDHNLKQK